MSTEASPSPDTRVGSGTPTTIEEFSYIVVFLYYYSERETYVQRCVGSLISSWHVLTTAYCFTDANLNLMLIRAGSTDSLSHGSLSTLGNVVLHPNYVEAPRTADIAVTNLSFPMSLSSTIGIVHLPHQGTYIPDGSLTTVVSWGLELEIGPQPKILKTVLLYKLPLVSCRNIYEGSTSVEIGDPVICVVRTGIPDMCVIDSGAPMTINKVLVGVASYTLGCGNTTSPDVFTRIDNVTACLVVPKFCAVDSG
ncbi:vitellin-degrading protease-like isoform X2 [Hyposmocoma kahamanoa]|nr:vitellin-degrading protease-like isoform X2 [Hyposmocoma kahamanoa]